MVGEIDAAGIVDRIGVDPPAAQRQLHPRTLREPEVAAFADDRRTDLRGASPHAVVRVVADLGVGLGAGTYVRTDPAVEEQVGLHAEDRADQPFAVAAARRPTPRSARASAESGAALAPRATIIPPADEDLRVVVRPGRTRQTEEPLALAERRLGIGARVEKDVGVVECGLQSESSATAAWRCRTRRRSCRRSRPRRAAPRWMSLPSSRKWRCTHSHAPRAVIPSFLWS